MRLYNLLFSLHHAFSLIKLYIPIPPPNIILANNNIYFATKSVVSLSYKSPYANSLILKLIHMIKNKNNKFIIEVCRNEKCFFQNHPYIYTSFQMIIFILQKRKTAIWTMPYIIRYMYYNYNEANTKGRYNKRPDINFF